MDRYFANEDSSPHPAPSLSTSSTLENQEAKENESDMEDFVPINENPTKCAQPIETTEPFPSTQPIETTQPFEISPTPEATQSSDYEAIDKLREKLRTLNNSLTKQTHHIYYCSRTHSQLDQAIQELKRSNFLMYTHRSDGRIVLSTPALVTEQQRELSMTVLASKSHYCINKAVLENPNFTVDEICGHERELAFLSQGEADKTFDMNCINRNESKW